jgi:hypothetical protein
MLQKYFFEKSVFLYETKTGTGDGTRTGAGRGTRAGTGNVLDLSNAGYPPLVDYK